MDLTTSIPENHGLIEKDFFFIPSFFDLDGTLIPSTCNPNFKHSHYAKSSTGKGLETDMTILA